MLAISSQARSKKKAANNKFDKKRHLRTRRCRLDIREFKGMRPFAGSEGSALGRVWDGVPTQKGKL